MAGRQQGFARQARRALLGAAFAVAVVAGGCGPDVPEHPTWELHVFPIVRARCVRCHDTPPRLDPLSSGVAADAADFNYPTFAEIPAGTVELLADTGGAAFLITLDGPGRMPLPPAAKLDDWQIETITRWTKDPR